MNKVEIAEANQRYGALGAKYTISAASYESAMADTLALLADDSWKQVGAGFKTVNDFVRSIPLGQFRIAAEQRQEFVARVQELQPGASKRAIAKALGVDHQTINNDTRGEDSPPAQHNEQQSQEQAGESSPSSTEAALFDAPPAAPPPDETRLAYEADVTKKAATGNLARIVNSLHPRGAPPESYEAQMFSAVDPRFWPSDAPPLSSETVKACADVLLSFVQRWEETHDHS